MSLRSLVIFGSLSLLTIFVGMFWWLVFSNSDAEPAAANGANESHTTPKNVLADRVAAESATVEILDYGFGENHYEVQAVVIVRGEVDGQTAELVTASVNFLDGEGEILATEALSQYLKWNGQQLVIPVSAYGLEPGTVKSIDPTVVVTNNKLPGLNVEKINPIKSTETSVGFGGDYNATFAMTNETEIDWMDITVGIACYGGEGEIIGGGSAYPGPLLMGKSLRLEASVTTSNEPEFCEAFLHPSLLRQ